MNKCLHCQIEQGGKVFAHHGFENDYCDKHKDKTWQNCPQLDYLHIDDEINLDLEFDMIHKEHDEMDRMR